MPFASVAQEFSICRSVPLDLSANRSEAIVIEYCLDGLFTQVAKDDFLFVVHTAERHSAVAENVDPFGISVVSAAEGRLLVWDGPQRGIRFGVAENRKVDLFRTGRDAPPADFDTLIGPKGFDFSLSPLRPQSPETDDGELEWFVLLPTADQCLEVGHRLFEIDAGHCFGEFASGDAMATDA